jgi:hypothetical protein
LASQSLVFILRKLEHEIIWKAVEVALHGPIELAGLDAIEGRKIGIEHNPLAPNGEYDRSRIGQ